MKDILKLAYNVFAMEFKLEISVIDALINQIQFGMDIFVNVSKDLLKLMDNVNLILDQQDLIILLLVLLEVISTLITENVSLVQQDA